MTLNLDDLEATAKAATPGPWRWDEDFGENGDTGLALTNDARAEVVGAYNWHCCSFRDDPTVEDNDAEHIAAFDPPTVLALIARLREAEANCHRACAAIGWDAAVAAMRYEDGTPVEIISMTNPYRP